MAKCDFNKVAIHLWMAASDVIFSLDVILPERKGLTVFQNACLSVTFFRQRYYNTVFVLLNSQTQ